jgi:dephospho-CoA kinase
MRVVGLTGGIASGKSTVARMLAQRGASIVDADQVARQIVEPGQPAYQEIVAAFGHEVLQTAAKDSPLDRKKLGAIVFADAAERARLNSITHPRIAAETQRRLAELAETGREVAIYEAALLVENGVHRALNGLIVAACSEAEQLSRLQARDGLSKEEALERVHAQAPLSDKLAVADWVIDTNGPLQETERQVDKVWAEIGDKS